MGKGKKFDAAEKHFEKKRIKMQHELNYLRDRCSELEKTNEELATELEKVKLELDALTKATNYTHEELAVLIEKDSHFKTLDTLFSCVNNFCVI